MTRPQPYTAQGKEVMRSAKAAVRSLIENRIGSSWFLRRAQKPSDRALRRSLLRSFDQVARTVRCEHFSREMLVMVDYILSEAPDGPLVECGCYLGGSSAKLSLVARATGRRLYICDSFEGLPVVSETEASFRSIEGSRNPFTQGQYTAHLDVVKNNVARAGGDLSVCEFVKGFFSDSLPQLSLAPAFIFSDADLNSSTRDVLKNLWPKLTPRGRFYTHDANLPELVYGILDPEYWTQEVGMYPPVMFGAGYGCGLFAGGIGYCEKR
jgi:O-methyltransferase